MSVPQPEERFIDATEMPTWAQEFAATVFACFNEIEGTTTGYDCQYSGPDTQTHDDHVFFFAPQPLEISGGPDDGEIVCDPLFIDIQAVQQVFTEVESTEYYPSKGDSWHLRRHV